MRSRASADRADRSLIVLRIGEIFLKGRNRGFFFGKLIRNARRLLADLDGVVVEPRHLRIAIHLPSELEDRCIERLGRLFGVVSMSRAVAVDPTVDAIATAAIAEARELAPGTRFKVDSKRRDKTFPMTSQQLSSEIGSRIMSAGVELAVDVRSPEHVIRLEVGREATYVFGDTTAGPGGLPVGSAGKVALLLSGGIDSPVAGWSVMRRGCLIDAVYFHSFPFTGHKTREKVIDLAAIVARWHGPLTLWVVHFTDVQKKLREHGRAELAVLLYRRMMMRAASLIGTRSGAKALVTGENIGQVASQTLENLGVIGAAATLPVLRPLLCWDKTQIIERAQAIDTFETSILPYDDCCTLFVPKHPATRARISDLTAAERGLDVEAMAGELAAGAERVEVEP